MSVVPAAHEDGGEGSFWRLAADLGPALGRSGRDMSPSMRRFRREMSCLVSHVGR